MLASFLAVSRGLQVVARGRRGDAERARQVAGLGGGAPLARSARVPRVSSRLLIVWVGLGAGCHRPGPATVGAPQPPPVVAPCNAQRIGSVRVTGATPAQVPGLAVLAGTFDDPERTARFVATATDALHMRGYPKAAIEVARTSGCFVDLDVRVTLGQRYRIDKIVFETEDEFPARERLAAVEDALGTVNTVGGVYIEYRLQRALEALQKRYRDAGWLDATIAPATPTYRGDKVTLTIPVTAGPRFRVAKVRVRGSDKRARAAVLDELAGNAGEWYDGPAIRTGIERARRKLDRWVELRTSYGDDGEIVIEAVVEGKHK
jgi:hemolysin activation/secretion protein